MDELMQDPDYRAFLDEVEDRKARNRENYRREAAGLLQELADGGFDVEAVGDLVHRVPYEAAIPVLVRWLPRIRDRSVKADVVRALSVPWARPEALAPLIHEFRQLPNDHELGLRWAVGNALEVIADDSVFDDLRELAATKKYGRSRQMVVMALGKVKNPEAADVLIGLLDDEDVVGHAVVALGKLKAKKARSRITELLDHPEAWIRKEANEALARIG
jgi:hypothetical protein